MPARDPSLTQATLYPPVFGDSDGITGPEALEEV
jgi:hypothetical protein